MLFSLKSEINVFVSTRYLYFMKYFKIIIYIYSELMRGFRNQDLEDKT